MQGLNTLSSLEIIPCSKAGLWMIQQLEPYHQYPYKDGKNLIIGYGHKILKGKYDDTFLKNCGNRFKKRLSMELVKIKLIPF